MAKVTLHDRASIPAARSRSPSAAARATRYEQRRRDMATQQEREAFLRGWRAAMDEVLAVLATEAREWEQEEQEASQSGEYKLPGSFALEEVRGSFKGRHELLAWVTQTGPAANQRSEAEVAAA